MNTGKAAEEFVKEYYRKQNVRLVKTKGELGYDFKNEDSTLFIEVKGATTKDLTRVLFRYFTNTEYEKARLCKKQNLEYRIHLVIGIGTDEIKHYIIPGKVLLDEAKPEISWNLPIRKKLEIYLAR
ncbi:MAG: DUF3883 domain-containing protein [Candidatus Pacearchaeota archaeon]